MKGRLIRGWQLRSTGYPGTLTGQGQWNGKTLRVTSWSVGAPATRGTAALSFNPTTRALIGAWKASRNGAGAWKLSLGEPPTC